MLAVFTVLMRQICHPRSGGLALRGAAHRGRRTKATLMEKACRRGSRTNLGLVGVAGDEGSLPHPQAFYLKFVAPFLEQFGIFYLWCWEKVRLIKLPSVKSTALLLLEGSSVWGSGGLSL